MPTFRFFLCNGDGYIVRVIRRFCEDEADGKFFAYVSLAQAEPHIRSVELWDETKALHRVSRDDEA
jgi:hypothetical protein